MQTLLKVENLCKSFGDIEVLHNINFEINRGDIVVIIGPSGSGKSTFLRCLNFLEKPTNGKILLNDKEMKDNLELHKKIGMVFQSFNLFSNLTVLENITLAPIKTKQLSKKEAQNEAMKLLRMIGLEDKKDVYPDNLSGGQRQRVAIIRSLIMNPEIMLFDEPTSALDPEMIEEVLTLMKEVAQKGMTMVIVTHELDFANDIANKIVFMDEGKLVETGTPTEVFKNPKTERLKEFLSKIK